MTKRYMLGLCLGLVLAVVLALIGVGSMINANATGGDGEPCVPSDAWTETIDHPAVTHEETVTVVDEEAWTEVIPEVAGFWQNFSPNKENRPFTGPPSWPADERGTWQGPHTNGGPQPDAQGVFQNGQGNGSWFYRQQPVAEQVIEHPAVTHEETTTVVDEEAWTEVVDHDAVTCEEPPVDEPKDPKDPENPPLTNTPVSNNPPAQLAPPSVPTAVDAGL